jgi:hypothetical protein
MGIDILAYPHRAGNSVMIKVVTVSNPHRLLLFDKNEKPNLWVGMGTIMSRIERSLPIFVKE